MSEVSSRRTEKLQVMLSDAELSAIDDWRFAFRQPSRAAAIRELISRGLKSPQSADQTGTSAANRQQK